MTAIHQFFSEHRGELLARVGEKLKRRAPAYSAKELTDGLPQYLDELIGALQPEGSGDSTPLPEHSRTAPKLGAERQHAGVDIGTVVQMFGAISDSFGELAAHSGLSFAASEYHVFNQCIDASIALAIETFAHSVSVPRSARVQGPARFPTAFFSQPWGTLTGFGDSAVLRNRPRACKRSLHAYPSHLKSFGRRIVVAVCVARLRTQHQGSSAGRERHRDARGGQAGRQTRDSTGAH